MSSHMPRALLNRHLRMTPELEDRGKGGKAEASRERQGAQIGTLITGLGCSDQDELTARLFTTRLLPPSGRKMVKDDFFRCRHLPNPSNVLAQGWVSQWLPHMREEFPSSQGGRQGNRVQRTQVISADQGCGSQ